MDYCFHHLHLKCHDLDQMQDFFTQVLGATLVQRRMLGPVEGAILDLSGTSIFLTLPREDEELISLPANQSYAYDHLGLIVDDIEAAYQELSAKGYSFSVPPMGEAGKIAFFQGPEGLNIELFQPPK